MKLVKILSNIIDVWCDLVVIIHSCVVSCQNVLLKPRNQSSQSILWKQKHCWQRSGVQLDSWSLKNLNPNQQMSPQESTCGSCNLAIAAANWTNSLERGFMELVKILSNIIDVWCDLLVIIHSCVDSCHNVCWNQEIKVLNQSMKEKFLLATFRDWQLDCF
jgi:hypothetical protein